MNKKNNNDYYFYEKKYILEKINSNKNYIYVLYTNIEYIFFYINNIIINFYKKKYKINIIYNFYEINKKFIQNINENIIENKKIIILYCNKIDYINNILNINSNNIILLININSNIFIKNKNIFYKNNIIKINCIINTENIFNKFIYLISNKIYFKKKICKKLFFIFNEYKDYNSLFIIIEEIKKLNYKYKSLLLKSENLLYIELKDSIYLSKYKKIIKIFYIIKLYKNNIIIIKNTINIILNYISILFILKNKLKQYDKYIFLKSKNIDEIYFKSIIINSEKITVNNIYTIIKILNKINKYIYNNMIFSILILNYFVDIINILTNNILILI